MPNEEKKKKYSRVRALRRKTHKSPLKGEVIGNDWAVSLEALVPGIFESEQYPRSIKILATLLQGCMNPEAAQTIILKKMEILLKKARADEIVALGKADCEKKTGKQNKMKARRGKRKDLGEVVWRSSFEANIARYLTQEGYTWEYEPTVFQLVPKDKEIRGPRTYMPDFRVEKNGEKFYVEVKGKLWPGDTYRFRRFKKEYPQEWLVVYTHKNAYKVIKLIKALGYQLVFVENIKTANIPNWE